uniref:Peptidase S8/S53 domain-containing protein n=1 Tax=Amphimedon queenslandica TaxID=400682 RepID=A0A1X7V1C3_AMPQE
MEMFNQDVDIDLSPLPKDIDTPLTLPYTFNHVKDHMRQFSNKRYTCKRNIISCYRAEDNTFIRAKFDVPNQTIPLFDLFFPTWILLALIPEEKERRLTIEKLVVAHKSSYEAVSKTTTQLRPLVGKGSLIIKRLTVVCLTYIIPNIMDLKRELKELGNVTLEYIKLKVLVTKYYDYKIWLKELRATSEGSDELKLMLDYEWNGEKIIIDDAEVTMEISDHLEDDDLAAEVPLIKGIRDSPHKMLGYPSNVLITSQSMPINRILIATLGYGFYQSIYTHGHQFAHTCTTCTCCYKKQESFDYIKSIDMKNFTNCTAPVYQNTCLTDDDTNKSKFIICQTTYCDGTIANGATSKAIQWLREKWEETWNKDYDNLLVLIPYGGQYMEDEMIQIHKATDEGIIIVCAAGELGGGVVFPAALGTVLSVGMADNGPKGREVDIHVPVSQKTFLQCRSLYQLIPNYPTPVPGCAAAAAIFTGLLALLISRINHVLDSNLTDRLNQALAGAIRATYGHLHTYVIRELLVSEGNGSHHPQLGYGDGEKIINHLLSVGDGVLLEKLANVLLIDDASNFNKTTKLNTIYNIEKIDEEEREKSFHNLDGRGITVTVLDQDTEEKEEWIGKNKTSFKPFLATGRYKQHGEECASVLHTICPNASILCANNVEEDYHLAFTDCKNHEPPIDVISYSLSMPSFYYDMCRVVNEAVVAGKIIVFAAGNTGKKERNTVEYPGRIGNILVVGGRDESHNRIGFSAIGREMDFLAEGEIGTYSGTSYAAPVVAGYIALLLQFIKENMNTDQDKIRAWSKNEEEAYEWRDIPAFDAAHNVYAMRTLLKLLVPKPQDHTETEGFGCLDFSKLFPCYRIENSHELVTGSAKTKIHETLQKFYKRM